VDAFFGLEWNVRNWFWIITMTMNASWWVAHFRIINVLTDIVMRLLWKAAPMPKVSSIASGTSRSVEWENALKCQVSVVVARIVKKTVYGTLAIRSVRRARPSRVTLPAVPIWINFLVLSVPTSAIGKPENALKELARTSIGRGAQIMANRSCSNSEEWWSSANMRTRNAWKYRQHWLQSKTAQKIVKDCLYGEMDCARIA
jgi:hypothetical protein